MRWIRSFILLLIFSGNLSAQSPLQQARNLFETAPDKEADAEQLLALGQVANADPRLQGYSASASMILADHYWNPISKLNSFLEGKERLEAIIASHPELFELRFLRLLIQSQVPEVMNYTMNIEEDKKFLIEHFSAFVQEPENKKFATKVFSYLKGLNLFEPETIANFQSILESNSLAQ